MGHFPSHLFPLQLLAPNPVWSRDPWGAWSVLGANALLTLCLGSLGLSIAQTARQRRGTPWNRPVAGLAILALACGGALAAAVYPFWHGGSRFAGCACLVAAAAGLLATVCLALTVPRHFAGLSQGCPGDRDAALVAEKKVKRGLEAQLEANRDQFRQIVVGISDYCLVLLDPAALPGGHRSGTRGERTSRGAGRGAPTLQGFRQGPGGG